MSNRLILGAFLYLWQFYKKALIKGMNILNSIKSIFDNAKKNASVRAWEKLGEGEKISFSPKSDRYTFGRQYDTQYDKKWKPATAEEKKTLSPEGYFRIGERQNEKDNVFRGIFEAAKEKAKASDEKRVADIKAQGGKARRTNKRTLEKNAKAEAYKIFNEEYHEKQVSMPSTAIKNIKYTPKTEGLKVKFQGGKKEYFYPAVPMELVQRWLKAPSKGEFFMKNIHDQYSIFGKDHRAKNKAEQKGVKRYMKSYEKKNANHKIGGK